MQEDALVCLAELERLADLPGAADLDVAHADHRALGGRERGDRGDDEVERLALVQGLARQLVPVRGEDLPAAGIPVAAPAEAVAVDRGLALALGGERRERHGPRLPDASR